MFWEKPELSIVIPVLNTKPYIAECLESVLSAIKNLEAEIIFVDDGSSDGSFELLREYAEDDKRIKVLQTLNKGPGGARNCGVAAARGKYLAFVDSDDFVAEDIYERMLSVARRDKCDMVVCDAIRKDGTKYTHSELHRKAFHNIRDRIIDIAHDKNLVFDGTVWNRLIRTSFYKKSGAHFSEEDYYEDVPIAQLLHLTATKVSFVRKWGYCWRIRKESISQQQFEKKTIYDRLKMLSYMKKMANDMDAPQEYKEMLDYKILSLEFNGFIAVQNKISEDEKKQYLEDIASFIEKNVDLRVSDKLSLYDQQKVKLILDRNSDELCRLLNYRKYNYMNAPVTEDEDGYRVSLPASLFSIDSRGMENEFNDIPYWMSIDSAERKEDSLVIHTHIYIRRINMPDYNSQDVKVFLINDLSGAEIELPVTKELRPSLTTSRGAVLNYDDYREYHYNYDGTGFSFEIKPEDFADRKEFAGHNYIMMECTNKLGHKNQVLRFGTKQALDTINSTEISTDSARIDFSTDEIQVFWIVVRDKN